MQWLCRAIKLCIISVKIDGAIVMKITFEMKKIFSLIKVMWVIENKKVFKVGLNILQIP